jgi:hypothetical protein
MILSCRLAGFRYLEIDTITSQMNLEILMKILNPKIRSLQIRRQMAQLERKRPSLSRRPHITRFLVIESTVIADS